APHPPRLAGLQPPSEREPPLGLAAPDPAGRSRGGGGARGARNGRPLGTSRGDRRGPAGQLLVPRGAGRPGPRAGPGAPADAGVVVLLGQTGRRSTRFLSAVAWCAMAVLVVAAHLATGGATGAGGGMRFVCGNPGRAAHFFLAMAGAGLAQGSDLRGATLTG